MKERHDRDCDVCRKSLLIINDGLVAKIRQESWSIQAEFYVRQNINNILYNQNSHMIQILSQSKEECDDRGKSQNENDL